MFLNIERISQSIVAGSFHHSWCDKKSYMLDVNIYYYEVLKNMKTIIDIGEVLKIEEVKFLECSTWLLSDCGKK